MDSESVDFQSTVYAAKGKAKESRFVSGTARDVGNAAGEGVNHEFSNSARGGIIPPY